MSSVQAPEEWKGTFVSTLDALLFVRSYAEKTDSVLVFVGHDDVRRFRSFVSGIVVHLFLCGAEDRGYQEFMTWLRIRHQLSSGPWEEKLLEEAHGDHHAAIRRYLDECAEFCRLHPPPR